METEYQAFKIFYTKKLRTVYSDSYKRHMVKHTEEETWDEFSKMENKVLELEERHEYLTTIQTEAATKNTTPTTISVHSG